MTPTFPGEKKVITVNFSSMFSSIIKWLKKHWLRLAITFALIAAYVAIVGGIFDEICPSKVFLGVPCPGCGLTRAGLSLFRLDFSRAWSFNPMIYSLPVLLILWAFSKKMPKIIKMRDYTLIAVLVLSIIVFLARLCYSFGKEPLTLNESAVFFPLASYVYKYLRFLGSP
jgi:hypothetical protein